MRSCFFALICLLCIDGLATDVPLVVRSYNTLSAEQHAFLAEVDVWHIAEQGEVTFAIDGALLERLDELGFVWEIDLHLSKQLERTATPLPGQSAGIPGFPCYRTVEETFATAQALADAHPTLAQWFDVGDSWEKTQDMAAGYDLMLLKLTNSQIDGDKPKLIVISAIHAREYTTAELTTRFAEFLLDHYDDEPNIRWLLDHHEIHLLLITNPDGRKIAETGVLWRKNTDDQFCNDSDSQGIDLNRNFDFQWGCCGGSSSSGCSETYRGPSAASEPESLAVQAYLTAEFPDQRPDDLTTPAPEDSQGLFLDIHSYGEVVLSSWGFGGTPPNADGLLSLSRKLGFYNNYRPVLGSLSTVDGATKDFAYGRLGVPAYTIELGTSFFQDCTAFENTIFPDNLQALLRAARLVRTPYVTPKGPEIAELSLSGGVATPGATLDLQVRADDDRYNHENGAEPVQNIAAVEAYIDAPPWSDDALALPLDASDGTFDSVSELAEMVIDTAGLDEGEHHLFVRAQDADGHWGSVEAAFFYVLDPATAPRVSGTVRDAASGNPIAAHLSTGIFATESDAPTGAFELLLPEGAYQLLVSAPDYAATEFAIELGPGQSITRDIALEPICSPFSDDFDTDLAAWSTEGTWDRTNAQSHSPSFSVTDSPAGDYSADANISLTSAPLDFTDYTGLRLSFQHRHAIETDFDNGLVEISSDGGANWSELGRYTGTQSSWQEVDLDLSSLDGASQAQIRFRFTSDGTVQEDGWYIDDVLISGAGPACQSLSWPILLGGWPEYSILDLLHFLAP